MTNLRVEFQKTLFVIGDRFSFGGKIYFNNGNGEYEVNQSAATFSPSLGTVLTKVGLNTVTVTANSSSTAYSIQVVDRSIKGGVDISYSLINGNSVPQAISAYLDGDKNVITDFYLSRMNGGEMHGDIKLGWKDESTNEYHRTPAIATADGSKIFRAIDQSVIVGTQYGIMYDLKFYGRGTYPTYNGMNMPLLPTNNTWTGYQTFSAGVSVPDPTNPTDAVNKRYLESYAGGVSAISYSALNTAIDGIKIADTNYRLVPQGNVNGDSTAIAIGISSNATKSHSIAIGDSAVSPVSGWVSFDSPSRSRSLSLFSVDNIVFRNEAVDASKETYEGEYSLREYLDSKTIKKVDDELNKQLKLTDNASVVGGVDSDIITLTYI